MRLDEVAECQNGHAFYKDGYDESGVFVIDLGCTQFNVGYNQHFVKPRKTGISAVYNHNKYILYSLYSGEVFKKIVSHNCIKIKRFILVRKTK